jgi:protein tyrosine/serine phosphatase
MGLVDVILESKLFISTVLKAITIHLENNENGKVLIHCNLGKDRCVIVIMLCESMLGMKDDDTVDSFLQGQTTSSRHTIK